MVDYVSKNDFYEIRVASLITNLDRDSLLELYQPIIGARAASLYLTLSTQKKSPDGGSIFKTNQLLRNMQLTSAEFIEARHYLEAVGLIRTYESVQEDVRCYIYVIYSPKSPKAFFEDVLFSGLLIQSVGEKEAKKLANKWKVNLTIPEEYREVSASFVDVYNLNYDDPSFKKDFGSQILGRDHGRAQLTFSYDLFFSFVKENSSIDIGSFKKKEMKEISRLATLFGLNEKAMAYIIIDEYMPEGSIHLDFERIRDKCEHEIRFSQLKSTAKSEVSGDSELANKIRMMEEVAPTKFLQYLQQGTKPARSDIAIVNSLSKDYGFSNGVINVIVEYVLYKNSNVLSKNYAEKIASSLARERVSTTVDAMNYLKKLTLKSAPKKKVAKVEVFENDDSEISLDEMNDLLNELEVKKNGK
jgi:replication initiation and membrane attachment protein